MQTALEGTMSEDDHLIMIVSTFHEPDGFFAETWDFSKDRGFDRYKFDIFDSMKACAVGMGAHEVTLQWLVTRLAFVLPNWNSNCPGVSKR